MPLYLPRYGPKMVADGELTGGEVMTVFFCIMIGSFSIGNMTPSLSAVATARGAAVTLYDVIDEVRTQSFYLFHVVFESSSII